MKAVLIFVMFFFCWESFTQQYTPVQLDSLKNRSKSNNPKQNCNALLLLSEHYSNTDLNTSIDFAKKALKQAKKIKNDSLLAVSYNSLANSFHYKTELDSAIHYHNYALQYRINNNDSLGIADSYNNLGISYDSKGYFSKAQEYYFKALKLYEKLSDKEKLAMIYMNIGIVYKSQKELTKAYPYYLKSHKMYKELDLDMGVTITAGNIGSILIDFEKYDQSITYSETSLKGYEKLGFDRFLGYPLSNIAIAQDSLHQFEKANNNYKRSVFLHKKYDNQYEVANICNAFATCLIKQKKYQQSIAYSDTAIVYAKNAKAHLLQVKAHQNMGIAYAKLNQYDLAFHHTNLYVSGKDSLIQSDKIKTIFELEAQYESEKKAKLLLQKEFQVEQKNKIVIILFILSISSIIIGFLIFRQQKLKNNQQQKEFQLKEAISKIESQNELQNQRLAISRDLHDNIGAQLTFIISSIDNLRHLFSIENKVIDGKLKNISSFTRSTIIELRDTIWAMNNVEISCEDLKLRILNFIEKAQIAVENITFKILLDDRIENVKFTSFEGMNIYRSIQEAVNNSIKYAHAKNINVVIEKNHLDEILVSIIDDGTGFEINQTIEGNGLRNIRKRVEEIGGKVVYNSVLGKGTQVEIHLKISGS